MIYFFFRGKEICENGNKSFFESRFELRKYIYRYREEFTSLTNNIRGVQLTRLVYTAPQVL